MPCVIINVQRFGPSTGLATKPAQGDVMQSRWGTHGDHGIIVLSPSSVQECYTLMRRSFELAYRYRTPVILLADESIGHLRESATVDRTPSLEVPQPETDGLPYALDYFYEKNIPPFYPYGSKRLVRFSGSMYGEDGLTNNTVSNAERFAHHFTNKIEDNWEDIISTDYLGPENADVVVIAYGCSVRSAQESVCKLQNEGYSVGLLKLTTLWPFAGEAVKDVCAAVKAVVVPEMNLGQIADEVRKYAGLTPVIQVNQLTGHMILPERISAAVREAMVR